MKRPAIKNVNDSPENQGLFWNVSFCGMGRGGNVVLVQRTVHVISSIVLQLSIILRIISWFHG